MSKPAIQAVPQTPVTAQLIQSPCQVCLGVLQHQRGFVRKDEVVVLCTHHRSVAALIDAASQGCKFCLVYWNMFTSAEKDLMLQKDGDELSTCKLEASITSCGDGFIYRINRVQVLTTLVDEKYAEFILRPSRLFDRTLLHTVHSDRTDSDETYDQLSRWLSRCKSSHKECRTRQSFQPWFPTRLLDLAADEGSVRLIDSRTHALTGKYMTLSHRWGSSQFLRLEDSTSHDLYHGVPVEALPQAFRDSVAVTLRTGVRYLWIDSLCIFQDDELDWQRESALMEKVYSNSTLNISSLAAEDSSCSFFANRGSQAYRCAEVTMHADAMNLTGPMIPYTSVERASWDREFNECPLHHRGWVMQERLLAPRVVHYGQEQIAWECRKLSATESFPISDRVFASLIPRFKDLLPLEHNAISGYSLWNAIVTRYSRCELTEASDKLVAVAGLANHFASVSKDQYIAGMWRKHLAVDLLWYHGGRRRSQRARGYRAPSFSWASIDGDIMMLSSTLTKPIVKIIAVELEYATADTFVSLKGGELTASGRLYPFESFRGRRGIFVDGANDPIGWAVFDEPIEDFDPHRASGTLYCMPWARDLHAPVQTYHMLLQVIDAEQGSFRRIGICFPSDTDAEKPFPGVRRQEPLLPCVAHDSGRYTIRII